MIPTTKVLAMAAAAAALAGLGGTAQAQGYGYPDELPPPPYVYVGAQQGGACGNGSFTLLGAHAGVTVLGIDLGAGAHLSVPAGGCRDEGYGEGRGEGYSQDWGGFAPRPYAPPPPPPMAYGYQAYGYSPPCGCQGRGW